VDLAFALGVGGRIPCHGAGNLRHRFIERL
jgi:hypothetical protein